MTAFLIYGVSCLMTKNMFSEFKRYKLEKFRALTGALQILGSLGLFAGLFIPIFTLMASLGLALQMFLGIVVRLRIKDSLLQIAPAFIFCILNSFIFWMSFLHF